MRHLLFFTLLFATLATTLKAQTNTSNEQADYQKEAKAHKPKFGIKAGYNVAKVIGNTPDFSPQSKNGFMLSAFFAPIAKSGFGYRTELTFSRQGFGFEENGKTNAVTSDYIYLPQLTTFSIGKFFQLQAGGQIGYLLKSSKEVPSTTKSQDITSFTSRFDYGAAAGIEIYPFKGLILGGRYNFSLGEAYKKTSTTETSPMPIPFPLPFNPAEAKGKNAVINFFVGYRF